MKKNTMCKLGIMFGMVCMLGTACGGGTKVEPIKEQDTTEVTEPAKTEVQEEEDSRFLTFPERERKKWNYDGGEYPTTFVMDFCKLPRKEWKQAWRQIQASALVEKTQKVTYGIEEAQMIVEENQINPAYYAWCTDSKRKIYSPLVAQNPPKVAIDVIYTTEDTNENVLYGCNAGIRESTEEEYAGSFIVAIEENQKIKLRTWKEATNKYKNITVRLAASSVQPEWMYDYMGDDLILSLTKEDFEKLFSKKQRATGYYIKAVKGKEAECREFVKSVGGYVYEDAYFE